MELWIDNTGPHATERCLSGHGHGEPDVSGLLQTATQIVFADAINFSVFESPGVQERSTAYQEQARTGGGGAPASDQALNEPAEQADAADAPSARR